MYFIDFEQQVGKIRVRLAHETDLLFKNSPSTNEVACKDDYVAITTAEGSEAVSAINYDGNGTFVTTKSGEVHDFMDLDTDDMVALYEYVYYAIYDKDNI